MVDNNTSMGTAAADACDSVETDDASNLESKIIVNVGYENKDGKARALDAATNVVQLLEELNAVTIEAEAEDLQSLNESDNIRYVEAAKRVEGAE